MSIMMLFLKVVYALVLTHLKITAAVRLQLQVRPMKIFGWRSRRLGSIWKDSCWLC